VFKCNGCNHHVFFVTTTRLLVMLNAACASGLSLVVRICNDTST
jgi:hypothetical protein